MAINPLPAHDEVWKSNRAAFIEYYSTAEAKAFSDKDAALKWFREYHDSAIDYFQSFMAYFGRETPAGKKFADPLPLCKECEQFVSDMTEYYSNIVKIIASKIDKNLIDEKKYEPGRTQYSAVLKFIGAHEADDPVLQELREKLSRVGIDNSPIDKLRAAPAVNLVPVWAGLALIVLAVVFIILKDPAGTQTPFLTRVLLSLGAAGVASSIPGMLKIKVNTNKTVISAVGSIAVFVVVWLPDPGNTLSKWLKPDTMHPRFYSELNESEQKVLDAFNTIDHYDDLSNNPERKAEIGTAKAEILELIKKIDDVDSLKINLWNQEFQKAYSPAYFYLILARLEDDQETRVYYCKSAIDRASRAETVIKEINSEYASKKDADLHNSVKWLDNEMFADRIISIKAKAMALKNDPDNDVKQMLSKLSDRYRATYDLKANPILGKYLKDGGKS